MTLAQRYRAAWEAHRAANPAASQADYRAGYLAALDVCAGSAQAVAAVAGQVLSEAREMERASAPLLEVVDLPYVLADGEGGS